MILIYSIPIITTLIIMIFGRYFGYKGNKIIGILGMGGSMIMGIKEGIEIIRQGERKIIKIMNWWELGKKEIGIEIGIGRKEIIMIILITTFTLGILIYSYWYLEEDNNLSWYIPCLISFAYSMEILVSYKNWIWLYIGWELVGIFSFFLIIYWSNSISNYKSGLKAWLFNKIGDISLLYYILTYNTYTSSWSIFLAAIIKSSQFFFHPWLSDAMAGPTPVSSLLHAATMVTAGIFILIKEEENINLDNWSIWVGILTTILAGIVAYNQLDIKKIIAFSTCSHLGLMLYSISLNKEISFYHLFSHAYFKSLLFLTSGLIIHLFSSFFLLNPNQDIRNFSLLSYISPYYSILKIIGLCSLIGLPTLSGYYSKERILLLNWISLDYYTILVLSGGLVSWLYAYKLGKLFSKQPNSILFNPSLTYKLIDYSSIGTQGMSYFFIGSIILSYILINLFISPIDSLFNIEFLLPFNTIIGIISRGISWELMIGTILILSIVYGIRREYKERWIKLMNLRFFIDYLQTYLLTYPTLSSSYFIFLKSIDRGILEWFGPLGLSRIINQYYVNSYKELTPNLIKKFLLSLIVLSSLLFIFLPIIYK